MPGLVGLITQKPPSQAERELDAMLASASGAGAYLTGRWVQPEQGVFAGWARRRNAASDEAVAFDQSREIAMMFHGEEYPEPGKFEGVSTPARLISIFEADPSFPASLNGRFHGLACDAKNRRAMLFNDRFGMQRLYIHETEDAVYFAAEAKSILAVRPELRNLDLQGFAEHLTCGCALENRTVFRGISLLPPAARWLFGDGKLDRKTTYFSPEEWESLDPLDELSFYDELRGVFSKKLPRYFEGNERIGMSVTGGLDTRMILACRNPVPRSLPCYSFGSMYGETQDVLLGRQLAAVAGQDHEVIPVDDRFLENFSYYVEQTTSLTDGCVGVDHSPDLFVNERAAEIAPIRMTGNYGGEIMRAVRAFKPMPLAPGLFSPELDQYLDLSRETYSRVTKGNPLTFAAFRQVPWHHYNLLSLEETQLSVRSPFLDNDFIRTMYRAPSSALESSSASAWLIQSGNDPAYSRIPTDRGQAIDGNRTALLRLRQAWMWFTVRAEYAWDYGMPQWLVRPESLASGAKPERLFLGRHKFYHFRIWYKQRLGEYLRSVLLDPRTLSRSFLKAQTVEKVVGEHLQGVRNHTLSIHKLLSIELTHRLLIDR